MVKEAKSPVPNPDTTTPTEGNVHEGSTFLDNTGKLPLRDPRTGDVVPEKVFVKGTIDQPVKK